MLTKAQNNAYDGDNDDDELNVLKKNSIFKTIELMRSQMLKRCTKCSNLKLGDR